MTKYRIVKRYKNPLGETKPYPYYYAQLKLFDLFWVDYHYGWFWTYEYYEDGDSVDTDLNVVEKYVERLIKNESQSKVKFPEQQVVKTYYLL